MSTTAELAVAVHKHLIKLKAGARFPRSSPKSAIPDASVLRNVFDVVYHASLKTEEGKSVIARLCVVDPNNPEDYPPPRPRPDRWAIVPLASRFPLNVATLVKIAQAADPWSSSLAVYYDAGGSFFIWGLIDQAVRWNRMLVREGLGYDLPGLINVVANGIADISVYRELGFLARLQQDTLIEQQNDVFWDGPVAERLQTWIEPSLESVRQKVTPELWDSDVETPSRSYDLWIGFLCRILLSIQRYRHGGALLLTDLNEELFPRYKISYDRASRHLEELAAIKIRERKNWTDLRRIIRERPNDAIPYSAYRNEFILNLADDD